MMPIDVEALRAQVRAMGYLHGTPDEVAQGQTWPNLVPISPLRICEDAMFAMMLDEGLPPSLMPSVILTLYGKDATAPDRAAAP